MIRNLLRILSFLITAALILAALYLFDLPPFSKQAETTTPATTQTEEAFVAGTAEQQNLVTEQANLPSELQDKVARTKTYDEIINRAQLLEKGGFPTLAIAEYQNAYLKDTSKTYPLYQIGKLHLANQNYLKAQKIYELILKKEPDSLEAKINLGKSLINQREIEKAKETFNGIKAGNQTTKYYQGLLAAYSGDHAKAKELLQAAADSKDNPQIQTNASKVLDAYREYDWNTESPTIHLKVLLARSFNQVQEYQMAIPLLFEVTKEKLDYRDAWILLGYAYLKTEKYPDAIEALERAKTLDPEKAETNFFLGIAYYTVNDFNKAETYLLKAKELGFEPKIQIDQKLAEIYLQLKNYQKSAESYEKVLSLNDNDVNYYIRPVWIYIEKLNQPEKALALSRKAVQTHPQTAMSHNLLAWSLIYTKNFNQAEDQLKSAMEIDPELDAIYLNYGILFEQKGESEKAISFYKKAHRLGNGDSVSILAAGRYNSLIAKVYNDSLKANSLQN
jgi:tetratricopeptide (TPR) repeat protein